MLIQEHYLVKSQKAINNSQMCLQYDTIISQTNHNADNWLMHL